MYVLGSQSVCISVECSVCISVECMYVCFYAVECLYVRMYVCMSLVSSTGHSKKRAVCVSRAYLVHVVVCFVDAKPSTPLLQTGLVVRPESKGDVSEAEVMSRSEALLSVGVENAEVRGERARCLSCTFVRVCRGLYVTRWYVVCQSLLESPQSQAF